MKVMSPADYLGVKILASCPQTDILFTSRKGTHAYSSVQILVGTLKKACKLGNSAPSMQVIRTSLASMVPSSS